MAWGSNWGGSSGKAGHYQNYATSLEGQGEDAFISEMLAESGKFNQDFFIMKIMSKAIDCISTDTGKFIMLIDVMENSLIQSGRLDQEYFTAKEKEMDLYEKNAGKEPSDLNKRLMWKEGKAGILFSIIFGKLSKTQPIEIIGEVDPKKYNARAAMLEERQKKVEAMPPDTRAAYNEYYRLKMRDRKDSKAIETKPKGDNETDADIDKAAQDAADDSEPE